LIFSRREVVQPKVLYLREIVGELENLLQRALGERVRLQTNFSEEQLPVEIDPSQLEQVLVNLAVNARDAMPEGGRLLIEIDRAELDEEYSYMHPDTEPGTYVRLKVSDTGVGMDPETVEHMFEPFYTTKSEGTGLGMATVYGIVTAARGRVDVYSEPGVGTTVKIHLPIAESEVTSPPKEPTAGHRANGEIVLLVEDEPEVRRMAERILSKSGFLVLQTDLGSEAVALCADLEQRIDLLLTDVIMPQMLGTELVEKARRLRPHLRVLYMSGYSYDALTPDALADTGESAFIEKPFSSVALLNAIGDLLREGAGKEE
jgi:CheY-like chemotaxis protein